MTSVIKLSPNNETLKFNDNLSLFDYTLFIKNSYVLNINISIKDDSQIHTRNLFLSALGDLIFKRALFPSSFPALITNERRPRLDILGRRLYIVHLE